MQFADKNNISKWMVEQADDMRTLRILMPGTSSRHLSPTRKNELQVLGAVCALMMIEGQTPEPFDPCIFQYIIHGLDFNSLHDGLIGEWHPLLRQLIQRWKEVGHEGDIKFAESNLISYGNALVCSTCFRILLNSHVPDLLM